MVGRLIKPADLDTANAGTPVLESPDLLPGLTYWLDAQQPMYTAANAEVVNSGDVVSLWPDQVGIAGLPTAAGKPTYEPTGINGKPAVRFNGTSSKITGPTAMLSSAYSNALTVYIVAKGDLPYTTNRVLFGTTSPNAWVELNGSTAALGATLAGVTGALTVALDATENYTGIYALSLGNTKLWQAANRNYNSLGGSQASMERTISGAVAFTGQTWTLGALGSSFYFKGLIGELLVYNGYHTPDQSRQVMDCLSAKWAQNALPFVLLAGNSLTSGTGSTGGAGQILSSSGTNYPSQLLAAYGSAVTIRTDAYPGRTLAQILAETPSFGEEMLFLSTGAKQVAVVWEVTNTLATSQSRSTAYRQLVRLCKYYRFKGFKVVVATALPRQDGVYALFETDRLAVNALIRANYSQFADGLADVAGVTNLQNPLNTTYYDADKVHLKDAGYGLVVPVVKTAVDLLLAA